MKIYTKTGDTGLTGLFGGQRVSKDDVRIESYGTIDEVNACLGAAVSVVADEEIRSILLRVQNELFIVGGDLATPLPGSPEGEGPDSESASVAAVPRVEAAMTLRLESEIDRFSDELGPLTHFILPGGSTAGALIHQARCICRRAERLVVQLQRVEPLNEQMLPYVNRLSDHLFELARLVNRRMGIPETIWSRETAAE